MPSWSRFRMNFDRNLDHEEIDEFLEHLEVSTRRRLRSLEQEFKNLTEEQFADPRDLPSYQDHLSEQAIATQAARDLGGQLSIVALYKKVESQTTKVVAKRLASASSKNLSYFKQLCDALPFDIKTVKGFASFNELRLLNNAIKHGGEVSQELASSYSAWKVGTTIESIGDAYERLLPSVKAYVFDLVTQVYVHGKP